MPTLQISPFVIIILCLLGLFAYFLFAPQTYSVFCDFDKQTYIVKVCDPLRFYRFMFVHRGGDNTIELSLFFTLVRAFSNKKKPDPEKLEKKKAKKALKKEKRALKKQKKLERMLAKGKVPRKKAPIAKRLALVVLKSENRQAISFILNRMTNFASKLMPKRIEGDLEFALDSPDRTGYVTGILSLIPYAHDPKLHVYPDFSAEAAYVSGMLKVKGYMILASFLFTVIGIIKNRNVRGLIKTIAG